MAWLTTYDDANKIVDEVVASKRFAHDFRTTPPSRFVSTLSQTKYRYTSMTKDAAVAGVLDLNTAAPAGTQRTAVARRQNDADAWFIEVFDISETAWALG